MLLNFFTHPPIFLPVHNSFYQMTGGRVSAYSYGCESRDMLLDVQVYLEQLQCGIVITIHCGEINCYSNIT